ncbi:hypothetical protein DV735_g5707, partial [Chaetothyriales sp. CBS 134920]
MVKSYLKFVLSKTFGQVCSATSNVVWDPAAAGSKTGTTSSTAGQAVVGANQDVLVWDIKKGDLVNRWKVEGEREAQGNAAVTVISRCAAAPDLYAVGYDDGKIRVWDSVTQTVVVTFNGHRSAVVQLAFEPGGARLASGSRDTDVIIWDLVSEVGVARLRGHKDVITGLAFLSAGTEGDENQFLLSVGKDSFIKLWDLKTRHCIETHITQTDGECWALGLSPDGSGCLTAGNDGEVKVWSIDVKALATAVPGQRILHERGTFYRQGKDKTTGIRFHPERNLVALHGSEKSVELWRIRTEAEVRKAIIRRRKRKRAKEAENDAPPGAGEEGEDDGEDITLANAPITDIIVLHVIVRTGGKVRSMDWAGGKSGKSVSILISTTNNQLELFEVMTSEPKKSKKSSAAEPPQYNRTLSVDMPGHRSDIRCVAISSDDRMIATASHGSLKIWNARTQSCLRTLDCGYALCVTFLPGDKIVVIGTREGTLEVFDIASSQLLDTISAHEKPVWAIGVFPDGKGIVTGSADKSAKFWDFKVVQEEVLGTTRKTSKLTLVHTRTLKLADDILALRFSPDHRLLAVSTLDSTVKVFFVDSLKLYLTLYGHKLPVLSISISYDSKLIITSSADKNVRLWGLDFGDCHKSFFAHSDSILAVSFVPNNDDGNGHHFFSAAKDGLIKYFDGDKFEHIQTLTGHKGEIWAMAVAHSGQFVVSASHDKSIRIWEQTDEQIFLEEEREKELEELYESTLLTTLEKDEREADNLNGGANGAGDAVSAPSKQTTETLMAGEKIAEALGLALEDLHLVREHQRQKEAHPNAVLAPPQRNPILTLVHNNVSASEYLLSVFEKIPAAPLQDALLVLSFTQLPALFTFLAIWAREGRNIPLTCRVLLFMLKVHQRQIVSSRLMRNELEELRQNLRKTLEHRRRELGFNLAGLRVLGRRVEEMGMEREFVDDNLLDLDEGAATSRKRGRPKKRAFVNVA